MLRGKTFVALVAVTAVVAAGAMLVLEREPANPEAGMLLFPELLARANDVARVEVTAGGEQFVLESGPDGWTAPSRAGFPLDADKVHNLIVGAAGLTRLEPKTGKPERFAELGLVDPQQQDSRAVGFALNSAGGETIAGLIVGERRPAKGDPTRTEYFVRVPGEDRSWLVVGTLPADSGEVVDWLQPLVVAVDGARIARVRVTHADGEVVTAERDVPGAGDFAYAELPDGAEVDGAWRVNDIGRVLTDLTLDDVTTAAEATDTEAVAVAVTETFDGLRVTMTLRGAREQPLALLAAEFDESLARNQAQGDAPAGLKAPDAVRDEVQSLNERWSRWAYRIPQYKFDYLARRAADLVKPPPQPESDAPPAPAAEPAPARE